MRVKITLNYLVIVMLIITCLIVQPVFAVSDNTVLGTAPVTQTNFLAKASAYPVTPHSIVPEITEVGKISASINALGTSDSSRNAHHCKANRCNGEKRLHVCGYNRLYLLYACS